MGKASQRVVVLGASENPERYSHKAVLLLIEHGHCVIPVSPNLKSVTGIPALPDLDCVEGHVDTVTVYVSPEKSSPLADSIISLHPDRVIFNPGAENPTLRDRLNGNGIATVEACTLIMLRTGQF
ncbi:MAG TPA: CoA-binding protein [Deltaproteobacteria bacterium]|nr:CoA-binding protein [Deltaproteobacteria bacterium]